VTRRQRCLFNDPPRQPSDDQTSLYFHNTGDKSLFLKTSDASPLSSIFCGCSLVFSIFYEPLGGAGASQLSVVRAGCQLLVGEMASPDLLGTSSASGEKHMRHRLKPVTVDKCKGRERGTEAAHYPNERLPRSFTGPATLQPANLAKSGWRIANSRRLRLGGSHAG
jgi:hypothetical protein